MSARRMVVFWCDDLQAAEDLTTAVDLARQPPWKPNPPEVRFGQPQDRYTEEEVAPFILDRLRRSGAKIALAAQVIVP